MGKVETVVWPHDENEKLEVDGTYSETSVSVTSNTAVSYPSGKLLPPREYCLKYHIHQRVRQLKAKGKEILLLATYAGERTRQNADLENILFYNIGTGAFANVFSGAESKQVAFWEEQPEGGLDDKRHVYRYEIASLSEKPEEKLSEPEKPKEKLSKQDIIAKLSKQNIIAKWEEVFIGSSLPNKPGGYYAALRKCKIGKTVTKCKIKETVTIKKRNQEGGFGIKITLTVPQSNGKTHPVSVMKPLLDGVICAFHGGENSTHKKLKDRFQNLIEEDEGAFLENLENEENWNVLGKRNYLTSDKWNPADERLKFGWIIVKQSGSDKAGYEMSGKIYTWD